MDASWKGRYHLLVPMHFGGSHFAMNTLFRACLVGGKRGLNKIIPCVNDDSS